MTSALLTYLCWHLCFIQLSHICDTETYDQICLQACTFLGPFETACYILLGCYCITRGVICGCFLVWSCHRTNIEQVLLCGFYWQLANVEIK